MNLAFFWTNHFGTNNSMQKSMIHSHRAVGKKNETHVSYTFRSQHFGEGQPQGDWYMQNATPSHLSVPKPRCSHHRWFELCNSLCLAVQNKLDANGWSYKSTGWQKGTTRLEMCIYFILYICTYVVIEYIVYIYSYVVLYIVIIIYT